MAGEAGAGGAGAGGYIAAAGSVMSTFIQVAAMKEMGRAARIRGEMQMAAYQFEAWEAERRAGEAIAISQRQSAEERRQANLVASRALAVAAASGAGVSDPTMVRVIANARGEGAVRAATALYEGQARARAMRADAALDRLQGAEALFSGAATQQGYALSQLGALSREGMSLYAKYGMNGPRGDSSLISNGGWQDTGSTAGVPDNVT